MKSGLDDFLVARGPEALGELLTRSESDSLQVFDHRDFLRLKLPNPEPVIEGIIRRGEVGCLYGASGTAKSLLGAECCRCVAGGSELFGRLSCLQGAAVLVEQESSHPGLQERLWLMNAGHPLPKDAAPFSIIPMQALTFDNEEARDALRAHVEEVRPVLLVVDTVVATIGNTDMNRAEQVRAWMNYWRALANDFSLAVLLIAHTPKGADREPKLESIFASVDFGAAVDCAFWVARVNGQRDTFHLMSTKQRWGSDADKLDLTFAVRPSIQTLRFNNRDHEIPWGLELVLVESAETVRRIVLNELAEGGWVRGKVVADAVVAAGFSDRAARKELEELVAKDIVEERKGEGKGPPREYRLLGEGSEK